MNVLVTGGAGFVGSHLCEELIKDKNNVYILDNYFSGSKKNHIHGCIYMEGETIESLEIFKDIKLDLIFHFGEYSRVEQSFDDIDLVFQYNWNSIYSILKLAKEKKCKFIYSGSSTKFGDSGETRYESPYAFTKHAASELVKTYCAWFDIDYAITYFYNVYGDREISEGKYSTIIAKFIKLKKELNKELPVVSPGTQRRNFTHVKDIVSGLLLVAKKGSGDEYGIGSSQSYSILELVELFGLTPKMLPKRRGNRMSAPVITEKTRLLGWKEEHSLDEYIKNEIAK